MLLGDTGSTEREGCKVVFKGTYEHSVDPKGRFTVPSKFREGLGEEFVVCKGFFSPCLYAFPASVFDDISQKMSELPLFDEDVTVIEQELYANAADVEMDKQGKVLVPANLREFAKIDKDVVVVGTRARVEIWAREAWDNRDKNPSAFTDAMRNLRQQGVKL